MLGAQERDGNIKKKGEECRKEARVDTFGQCAGRGPEFYSHL